MIELNVSHQAHGNTNQWAIVHVFLPDTSAIEMYQEKYGSHGRTEITYRWYSANIGTLTNAMIQELELPSFIGLDDGEMFQYCTVMEFDVYLIKAVQEYYGTNIINIDPHINRITIHVEG